MKSLPFWVVPPRHRTLQGVLSPPGLDDKTLTYLGHVAALGMSRVNGLQPFEKTVEQTIITITTSSKTITAAAMTTNITSLQGLLHYRHIWKVTPGHTVVH